MFSNTRSPLLCAKDRISDFEMKLMDIDCEHLGIPEQEYQCTIKMPSSEFQRIIRDLGVLGDTCTIGVTKVRARVLCIVLRYPSLCPSILRRCFPSVGAVLIARLTGGG